MLQLDTILSTTKSLQSNNTTVAQIAQNSVLIKSNRIYNHKIARFYYTTYDVRRAEDVINPRTSHSNIMLLNSDLGLDSQQLDTRSQDSDTLAIHPFIYGRVIGIYHANVIYIGPGMKDHKPMRFDFLHVHWFQLDAQECSRKSDSWASLRLDRLSLLPLADDDSLGFVDPSLVLRSCHLIPAFSFGRKSSHRNGVLRTSNIWNNYYVNRLSKIWYFTAFCVAYLYQVC